jgi:hypothetical protein
MGSRMRWDHVVEAPARHVSASEQCGHCLAQVPAPAFSSGPEHLPGCPRHEQPKRRVRTIRAARQRD